MRDYSDNEKLIQEIRTTGDSDGRLIMKLWNQNSGLIEKACKKFKGRIEAEDARQECFLPFSEAVKDYDQAAGQSFGSFAYNRCIWHLQRYAETYGSSIRVPSYQRQAMNNYKRFSQAWYKERGELPPDHALCRALGLSPEQLEQLRQDLQTEEIRSLDVPLSDDPEGGTLADIIPGEAASAEADALESVYSEERRRAVWAAVDTLRPQDGAAIRLYFQEGRTFAETGRALGVKADSARAMLNRGIRQLGRGRGYRVLRDFADGSYTYTEGIRGGVGIFKNTWTSSTENAALKSINRDYGFY